MRRAKRMFAGRGRVVTLAALVGAAALCTLFLWDAFAPAEAKSATERRAASNGDGLRARVRLEALGTQRDGVTGRPRAGTTYFEGVGETVTRFLDAGDGQDPSVCNATLSESRSPDSVLLWKFETNILHVSGGRSTLQVHWIRSRGGSSIAERDETRTITLEPGDTHVLDFVENPSPANTACASLLVRIAADPLLQLSSRPVMVDLWTVDESAPGGARSVHQQVHGLSDDSLTYELPPLGIEPVSSASTRGHTVKLQVGGRLQAVLLPDGFVDVTLNAVRRTVSGKATVQGEGRVQFRSKVGETAAVLLPEPAWRLPLLEGDGAVDLRQLFAGHKLSLYVRVEPAQ